LTALQNVFDALHRHDQRLRVLDFQNCVEGLKGVFKHQLFKLGGACVLSTVGKGPNCLFPYVVVVVNENVHEFVY